MAFQLAGCQIEIVIIQIDSRYYWMYAIDGIEHHELCRSGWPDEETAFAEAERDALGEVSRRDWVQRYGRV